MQDGSTDAGDVEPAAQEPVEGIELSFGPQRPALDGILRLRLALDGDSVLACQPLIGHLHRGVEKLMELTPYAKNLAHTDRLDFSAAATTNLAYCGAVEKLLGIDVPWRARFLRTLFAELQRIASHLLWLANHAVDVGAAAPHCGALRLRDQVLDLFELYCGARLTLSCVRPGGVPHDLPAGWTECCRTLAEAFPGRLDECLGEVVEDPAWKKRTVGAGVLAPETAIDHGVTGPMLRASGVDWDLRKGHPYEAYGELDFEVVTGRSGDASDRFKVRAAEMRQASRIVLQCLDRLPEGPVLAEGAPGSAGAPAAGDPAGSPRDGNGAAGPTGSSLQESLVGLAAAARCAEVYHAVEGPRGEVGFYLIAGADGRPHRCHLRAPSFYNLQALPEMVRGHRLGDLISVISSADIALGEVDR